jgi:hypothetical protein
MAKEKKPINDARADVVKASHKLRTLQTRFICNYPKKDINMKFDDITRYIINDVSVISREDVVFTQITTTGGLKFIFESDKIVSREFLNQLDDATDNAESYDTGEDSCGPDKDDDDDYEPLENTDVENEIIEEEKTKSKKKK